MPEIVSYINSALPKASQDTYKHFQPSHVSSSSLTTLRTYEVECLAPAYGSTTNHALGGSDYSRSCSRVEGL